MEELEAMLHFPKFRPNVLETRDAPVRTTAARQRPHRELRDMINPGLNLHSRSKGEPIPAETPLSSAADTRPPMQLAHSKR